MLACLEPKPTQQKKLVSCSGVRRKRRRSTESVEKPRAMLRGNTRPLTEAEKQVLGSNVGLNPNRILDRSEVASLIEDVDGRKRKKIKKQACVTVRPKARNAQNGNSQTALSGSRCNHQRIALTSPLKTCIVFSWFLAETATNYAAAQGHASVSYFGSSRSGKVLKRSVEKLNNFLKGKSALFRGFTANKKTYKALKYLWYNNESKFFELPNGVRLR